MNWQQELKFSIRSTTKLLNYLNIDKTAIASTCLTQPSFPIMVTTHFADLMKKGDPNDPLLKQVLAIDLENKTQEGFSFEPLKEDQFMPVPGLIHKYPGRALIMLTSGCAIHCRYCFRKHIQYQERLIKPEHWSKAYAYMQANNITEVIFSGGDPLLTPNQQLAEICNALHQQGIKRIRIHTRIPSILPSRIDEGFLALARSLKNKLIIVNHINHPQEISNALGEKSFALKQCGAFVYNQSVFLKGINDQAHILADLSEKLIDNHIQPYYIHQLDPVIGAQHFEVAIETSKRIIHDLRKMVPGYMVPLLVQENPRKKSKTPLSL